MTTAGLSRRERLRDATTDEIKRTARDLLVRNGEDALTLRAIAREMGMTAPALYRYFASHEHLLTAVVADLLDELVAEVAAARDAAPADPMRRLGDACRAFRRWALAHPREFRLTFASPHGHADAAGTGEDPTAACWRNFGGIYLGIFVELWELQPFPVPAAGDLDATLASQLRSYSAMVGDVLPLGALAVFVSCWVRLYGAVAIEVFGHIGFAVPDAEALFEQMLADMGAQLRARGQGRVG